MVHTARFDKRNSNYDDCEHVKFHEDYLKDCTQDKIIYIIPIHDK